MTWRYRIIRSNHTEYALHSVYIDEAGDAKFYSETPEQFAVGESTEFEGDAETARDLIVLLLTKALEDAQNAPILEINDEGQLVRASLD